MAAIVILVAGCEARNLYVAHDTVIGLNAQVNPSRQQGRLLIGYDRDFVTLIPIVPSGVENAEEDEQDAMALLGCTEFEVDGIFLARYSDELASGRAAVEFAKKLGDGTASGMSFFKCQQADPAKDAVSAEGGAP